MPAQTSKEVALKIDKVLNEFGRSPIHGTVLADVLNCSQELVLAMLLDAMIKARPISHEFTQKTLEKPIEAAYNHQYILSESTWQDRTMVLQAGGYNRYREQCAINIGELAKLLFEKYEGDITNILDDASCEPDQIRLLLKEVKGIGDLAVDIFFNSVQSVWPCIAPFVDSRSLKTAAEIGIGTDLDEIYNVLDRDPVRMSWFANGLSEVRLEKKQEVIEAV